MCRYVFLLFSFLLISTFTALRMRVAEFGLYGLNLCNLRLSRSLCAHGLSI